LIGILERLFARQLVGTPCDCINETCRAYRSHENVDKQVEAIVETTNVTESSPEIVTLAEIHLSRGIDEKLDTKLEIWRRLVRLLFFEPALLDRQVVNRVGHFVIRIPQLVPHLYVIELQ